MRENVWCGYLIAMQRCVRAERLSPEDCVLYIWEA